MSSLNLDNTNNNKKESVERMSTFHHRRKNDRSEDPGGDNSLGGGGVDETNNNNSNPAARSDNIEEIYRKFKNDTGYVGHGRHADYGKKQAAFTSNANLPPSLLQAQSQPPSSATSSSSSTIKVEPTTNKRDLRNKPLTNKSIKMAADDPIARTPHNLKEALEAIPSVSYDSYNPNFAESYDTAPGKSDMSDDDDDDDDVFDSEGDLSSGKKLDYHDKDKLTAKEKNREHAKNTRMRKKNYIESLKDSIKQMVDDREKVERERKVAFTRLQEQVTVRKKVLQEALEYRAAGVLDAALWGTLIEESIILVLPVTPFRSFPPLEVYQGQRYIRGIPAVIVDTASFYCMLQTVVPPVNMGMKIKASFNCNFNKAVFEENSVMGMFDMKTTNAVDVGCRCDLAVHGMLKAVFSAYNKLIFLELTFDVMMLMQQLRRASGRGDFLVVPNTPYLAQEQPNEARVITESVPPYRIVYVSEGWQRLFEYRREHILGKTCKILQGEKTEKEKVVELMEYVKSFLPCSTVITNYTASGRMFPNWIRIFPLYTEGVVTHFLGIMEDLNYAKLPTPLAAPSREKASSQPQHQQHQSNTYNPNYNNNISSSGSSSGGSNNNHNNGNGNATAESVVKTSMPTTGMSSISLAFRQAQQRKAASSVAGSVATTVEDSGPKVSALTKRLLGSAAPASNASNQPIPPRVPHSRSATSVTTSASNPGDGFGSDEFLYGLLKDFAKDARSEHSTDQNFQSSSSGTVYGNNVQQNNNNNYQYTDEQQQQMQQEYQRMQGNSHPSHDNSMNFSDIGNNEENNSYFEPNGNEGDLMLSDGEESFDANLLSY